MGKKGGQGDLVLDEVCAMSCDRKSFFSGGLGEQNGGRKTVGVLTLSELKEGFKIEMGWGEGRRSWGHELDQIDQILRRGQPCLEDKFREHITNLKGVGSLL